jgi:glycolate oxidase iron-sulfur subunit
MRTQFSREQLQNPDTREVEKILRKCVHCGFCNATCPTFLEKGDELEGPRGRIYLLKGMLENQSIPGNEVVKHIDSCLSCLSCMSTCPSGVDYMHLIDHGRAYIEEHHDRKVFDKILRQLLAFILPVPLRFRWTLKIGKLAHPFANLLPAPVRAGVELARHASNDGKQNTFEKMYPAEGHSSGQVGLIPGCAQQVVANEINMASIRLLNRFGFDVQVLKETDCCGAIEHHLGKSTQAIQRVRNNLVNWSTLLPELDAFVSNASGCGTMMKDYGHLLKNDDELSDVAQQVSNKTMDICEFLAQQELDTNRINTSGEHKVAYQNPCSMQHGQKINHQPFELLQKFGFDATSIPEAHLCCGSAGTYNLLQSEMAARLGREKVDSIASTGAEFVASGNLGCILQLRQYSEMPIMHTVQLLDWASGGPRPKEIA